MSSPSLLPFLFSAVVSSYAAAIPVVSLSLLDFIPLLPSIRGSTLHILLYLCNLLIPDPPHVFSPSIHFSTPPPLRLPFSCCCVLFQKRSDSFSAGPPWIIIIPVAGGVLVLAILVCVSTWWLHKQRKRRKDSKGKEQTFLHPVVRMKAGNSHAGIGQPTTV